MAKAKKKTASKGRRPKQVAVRVDQYTPLVVTLTWVFVLLALVFVFMSYWRYA